MCPLRCLATAVLALLGVATVAGEPAAPGPPAFQVIVNVEVRGNQIPRTVLSSIFLKEAVRWGDGHRVTPVDQSLRSPVREEFSKVVLQESIDAVQQIWNRKLTRGVMPPIVKSSDDEVVAYVAETAGAIGYVSRGVSLPPSVKALPVID
jgi:ABC-type phosphate transport system substrate-binding protein